MAAATVIAAAPLIVAPSGAAAGQNGTRVFSSGNRSELIKELPISKHRGAERRRIMEIGRARVPDLHQGDSLRVGAELQLTNNCAHPEPSCVGPSYRFSPAIDADLVLLGAGIHRSLGRAHESCGQTEPHREHHCVLVIDAHPQLIHRACDSCRIALFASAHDPRADGSQRILVGGNRPDGTIPQDRGRISAVQRRDGAPPPRVGRASRPLRGYAPIDKRRHVVLSKRLRGLRKGESLEVAARLQTVIAALPYSVRTTSQLVLARSPRAVSPDRRTARIALLGGEIDESTGFNCTQPRHSCTTKKNGVMRVSHGARRLYVNLVLLLGPKRAHAGPGDSAGLRHAQIVVRRYAPAR